jgi:hypothetical protein
MLSGDRKTGSSVLVDASIARQMSDMIRGLRTSQVVGTIAWLGIPDRLVNGARSAGELASLIGCHAGATHRLMRAAMTLDSSRRDPMAGSRSPHSGNCCGRMSPGRCETRRSH